MVLELLVIDITEFEADDDHHDVVHDIGAKVPWLCDPHDDQEESDEVIEDVVLVLHEQASMVEPAPDHDEQNSDGRVDERLRSQVRSIVLCYAINSVEVGLSLTPALPLYNKDASDCRYLCAKEAKVVGCNE